MQRNIGRFGIRQFSDSLRHRGIVVQKPLWVREKSRKQAAYLTPHTFNALRQIGGKKKFSRMLKEMLLSGGPDAVLLSAPTPHPLATLHPLPPSPL